MSSEGFSKVVLRRLNRIESERKIAEAQREALAAKVENIYRDTRETELKVMKVLRSRIRRDATFLIAMIGTIPLRVFFGLSLEICFAICMVAGFFYWLHAERRREKANKRPKLRHYD